MRQPDYDYHPTDRAYIDSNGIRWISYYVSKIVSANRLGCDSFVEGIKEAYRRTKSIRKAGELMGLTHRSFSKHARMIGIELNGPGGANRKKRS